MKEAILDLSENLKKFEGKLYLFQGTSEEVLTKIIQSVKINAVYTNRDYTPFSGLRDQALKKICYEHGIEFIQKNDLLLHEPEEIITGNGTPYSIFTPFFKRAGQMPVGQALEFGDRSYAGQRGDAVRRSFQIPFCRA